MHFDLFARNKLIFRFLEERMIARPHVLQPFKVCILSSYQLLRVVGVGVGVGMGMGMTERTSNPNKQY